MTKKFGSMRATRPGGQHHFRHDEDDVLALTVLEVALVWLVQIAFLVASASSPTRVGAERRRSCALS
jgi:hypothetical protein